MSKLLNKSLGMRLTVLALIAMAWWNPLSLSSQHGPDLFILVDDSRSTPRDMVDQAWRKASRQAQQLPDDTQIAILRFAKESVVEAPLSPLVSDEIQSHLKGSQPPRQTALNPNATNVEEALRKVFQLLRPGHKAEIYLVSDGRETTGNALLTLQQHKVRVVHFAPPVQAGYQDAWITTVRTSGIVTASNTMKLAIKLGVTSVPTNGTLKLWVNNRLVEESQIILNKNHIWSHRQITLPHNSENYLISAEFEIPDDVNSANNRFSVLAESHVPATALYVSRTPTPPMAKSLLKSEIRLKVITPQELALQVEDRQSVVILDDIAIHEIPAPIWAKLIHSVRTAGTGLIVLGGGKSFSSGGYRHSKLEEILPVTARTRQHQEPAALLLAVDKSGSMDKKDDGLHRFGQALRAVSETVKTLEDEDLASLVWFDTEPHPGFPFMPRKLALSKLDQWTRIQPNGGTRLDATVDYAINRLSQVKEKKRLLVILTDGYVDEFIATEDRINSIIENQIDLIAILIGEARNTQDLEKLTALNNGILLKVNETAALPRLVRNKVDQNKTLTASRISKSRVHRTLPFAPNVTTLPAINGNQPTREKPEAEVLVSTERGDPLIVVGHVNNARVVALPAGLNEWSANWLADPQVGALTGGLVEWVSNPGANENFELHQTSSTHGQVLYVDAYDAGMEWLYDAQGSATLEDENGFKHSPAMTRLCPGRYALRLSDLEDGLYRLAIRIGNQALQTRLLIHSRNEFDPEFDANWLVAAKQHDFLSEQTSPTELYETKPIRWPYLALALLLYLLTLAQEEKAFARLRFALASFRTD